MGYLQEVDSWLDAKFGEFADQQISFDAMKRLLREKILESYRNGQKEGGQPPAPGKPGASRSPNKPAPRKAQGFTGDWQCAKCGRAITTLPFEPRGGSVDRLQCIECYRKAKAAEGQ